MPRVSEEFKDRQRAEILAAARRCFVRDGFHRTSMQDVFVEAGKSAGAVYRYFPKKDDLIVGVATHNLEAVEALLAEALASDQGSRGLGEVMADLLEAVLASDREDQLATMALIVWAEAPRNPQLAERLRAAMATMTRDLAYRAARDGGGAYAESERLAQVALSIVPGVLLQVAMLGPDRVSGMPEAARLLLGGSETVG